jgi:hypothetical protein
VVQPPGDERPESPPPGQGWSRRPDGPSGGGMERFERRFGPERQGPDRGGLERTSPERGGPERRAGAGAPVPGSPGARATPDRPGVPRAPSERAGHPERAPSADAGGAADPAGSGERCQAAERPAAAERGGEPAAPGYEGESGAVPGGPEGSHRGGDTSAPSPDGTGAEERRGGPPPGTPVLDPAALAASRGPRLVGELRRLAADLLLLAGELDRLGGMLYGGKPGSESADTDESLGLLQAALLRRGAGGAGGGAGALGRGAGDVSSLLARLMRR